MNSVHRRGVSRTGVAVFVLIGAVASVWAVSQWQQTEESLSNAAYEWKPEGQALKSRSSGGVNHVSLAKSDARINGILDSWAVGSKAQAINELMKIADGSDDATLFRPYDFSEEAFVALPRSEREALQKEMLERYSLLKRFALDVRERAQQAVVNGERSKAERMLAVMKQLGEANTGPDVTSVAQLIGRFIRERAAESLDELKSGDE